MSAKQEDRKTNERGLELAYLGDLKARALGRCVAIDLAFVYASERFLAFDGWPAYAKIAAGDGASVLARLGDTPLAAPISLSRGCDWLPDTDYPREWTVRLAIFVDAGAGRAEPVLVTPDAQLITWELDEKAGEARIRLETARALAMAELIARAVEP